MWNLAIDCSVNARFSRNCELDSHPTSRTIFSSNSTFSDFSGRKNPLIISKILRNCIQLIFSNSTEEIK